VRDGHPAGCEEVRALHQHGLGTAPDCISRMGSPSGYEQERVGALPAVAKALRLRFGRFFLEIRLDVGLQAGHNGIFLALFQLFLNFFEGKVHDIVVVEFERRGRLRES
jgi:hypothetical protein